MKSDKGELLTREQIEQVKKFALGINHNLPAYDGGDYGRGVWGIVATLCDMVLSAVREAQQEHVDSAPASVGGLTGAEATPRTNALLEKHVREEYSAWESCKSYREHAFELERELAAARCAVAPGLCEARVLRSDRDRWKTRALTAEAALASSQGTPVSASEPNSPPAVAVSAYEALKRDAERYRWLRRLDASPLQVYDCERDAETSIFADDLDAAIDAAMQAPGTKEGTG